MSIFTFAKSLLPRIQRNNMAEDLRLTLGELANTVSPTWEAAANHFRLNRPTSPTLKNMETLFWRNYHKPGSKPPVFIMEIARNIPVLMQNTKFLSENLESYVEADIIPEGMTAKAAMVIRSASHLSSVSTYLSNLLNFVYSVEGEALNTEILPELEISKASKKYVIDNFERFVRLFEKYTMDPKAWVKQINAIPEVYVSPSLSKTGEATLHTESFDFLAPTGLSGFVGSAIYSVRMIIARWQQDRYEANQAKRTQLAYRLLYLQELIENGSTDATVENEIRQLQDRIEVLDDKLRTEEEKYGVFK